MHGYDYINISIQESGQYVTEQVTQNINKMLEDKFFAWEKKHENLKALVEDQERRIYFLEKEARNRNIVFFGIEEDTYSSYDILVMKVIEWIQQHLSIKLTYSDLQEVKRLGKKGDRPRPTVVTFSTLGLKKIYLNKRKP